MSYSLSRKSSAAKPLTGGELVRTLNDPPFAKKLADQGQDPKSSTPAELTAHMRTESERFTKIIKAAGVTLGQ